MRLTVALVIPLLFGSLAACGSDDDGDDSEEDSSSLPACSEVWVEGETLPEDYDGCMNDDTIEALVTIDCADGSQLATFDDRFWALLGGEVKDAGAPDSSSDDPQYEFAFAKCKEG